MSLYKLISLQHQNLHNIEWKHSQNQSNHVIWINMWRYISLRYGSNKFLNERGTKKEFKFEKKKVKSKKQTQEIQEQDIK